MNPTFCSAKGDATAARCTFSGVAGEYGGGGEGIAASEALISSSLTS